MPCCICSLYACRSRLPFVHSPRHMWKCVRKQLLHVQFSHPAQQLGLRSWSWKPTNQLFRHGTGVSWIPFTLFTVPAKQLIGKVFSFLAGLHAYSHSCRSHALLYCGPHQVDVSIDSKCMDKNAHYFLPVLEKPSQIPLYLSTIFHNIRCCPKPYGSCTIFGDFKDRPCACLLNLAWLFQGEGREGRIITFICICFKITVYPVGLLQRL